jgi:ubiquinone/menaquinone biosynthesis C-methylase UbiE
MQQPPSWSERLFALYYPRLAARAEDAGLREIRRRLISHASGDTLEVGAGTGLNLDHYPAAVGKLVCSEPSPPMLSRLRQALADRPANGRSFEIVRADVQALPFADQSFDTVLSSWVLCSVDDPLLALSEIARVLRPDGQFLFLEHVRAPEGSRLGRLQDLVQRPHRALAGGCHPNRRTAALIEQSPLALQWLTREQQPSLLLTVRPIILGSARRPVAQPDV